MARRSRRRNADTTDIANATESFENALLRPVIPEVTAVSMLDDFLGPTLPHDQRHFSFTDVAPEVYSLMTVPSVSQPQRFLDHNIGFSRPDTVAVCHRRAVRREVLFAKKRMRGRGGSRRRNYYSTIKC